MEEFIANNLDIFYWMTIIMLVVATIVILGFAIVQIINNKKTAKKSLLTNGGLIIVLLISYHVFASDEVLSSWNDVDMMFFGEKVGESLKIDAATSKVAGMGIWSFYILSLLAVSSIIYTEFSKQFLK
jgi:hypothetical protein